MIRFVISCCLVFSLAGIASASPVTGPVIVSNALDSNENIDYNFIPRVKEAINVRAFGNGNGNIDCELLDTKGNLLVRDSNAIDSCELNFTPQRRDKFILRITNNGHGKDEFQAYIY